MLGVPVVANAAPPTEPADTDQPGLVSLPDVASFNRCDKQSPGARFRITLPEEAELKDLVGWISSVSCQKFVWDPAVRGGKITIVAPEAVTLQEAYGAFHSALETMNLAVKDSGEFFEIVETKGIQGQNVPVIGPDGKPAASDRFATQVVRPHPERIADVSAVFEHLKSESGSVTSVGEIVIVTDTANNIRRAMKVAQQVDVSEETREGLYVYPLLSADAEETAELLRSILGEGETKTPTTRPTPSKKPTQTKPTPRSDASRASATLTRVVPDVRTRSLFIVAPREDYPKIRQLIAKIDASMTGDQGEITVVRLDHADPEELQGVITQVIGARKDDASERVTVTAEPATRSLIIDAPYGETQRLQKLIASLDIERRQVYMEVYLLEVSMERELSTAAGAHFARRNPDGSLGVISTNPSASVSSLGVGTAASSDGQDGGASAGSLAALTGIAAGLFGRSFSFLGQDVPSFGMVIQAISTSTDVNTISEPHVTTADNRTAKITVGEVIPFRNQVQTQGVQAFQGITREQVALEVEITPHVNDAGEIMLDLKLTNEEVQPVADDLGVRTSKRALELQDVVARDGQPVVLGGLIQDSESVVETKVPGLGSIPVVGWLFKSRRKPRKKVNLLMVLVPHVIESPDEARQIHERRMAERREFIERQTAFKRKDLDTHVNYKKKAGLLAAVQAEHVRMNVESDHRTRAEKELVRDLPSEIVAQVE